MKIDFLKIYNLLESRYGPQKWWPTTLSGHMHPSYHGMTPDRKGRFEIAVGAVLTQNTSWSNVEKAIFNLNSIKAMSPEKIIGMTSSELAETIRPSGYYNLKSVRLKSMASWWREKSESIFSSGKDEMSSDAWRESLLSVHGVGEETADSILLYSFDFPTFVIDAYTRRIMSRHFGIDKNISYGDLRKMFMKNLPGDVEMFKEYHALLVNLAKESCLKAGCRTGCPLECVNV